MRGLGTAYSGPITPVIAPQSDIATFKASPVDTALEQTPADGLNPNLIPDGFSLNVHLKYLPFRSYAMFLRLLDDYRREALLGLWQPRWYAAPIDATVAIAAGDTINPNIRMAKGAVIYGYSFAAVSPATAATFRVTVRDVCGNYDLISQYEIASGLRANFTAGTPSSGFGFVPLSAPYHVAGKGDVQVNIVNTDASNARQCQLVLLAFEPMGNPQ